MQSLTMSGQLLIMFSPPWFRSPQMSVNCSVELKFLLVSCRALTVIAFIAGLCQWWLHDCHITFSRQTCHLMEVKWTQWVWTAGRRSVLSYRHLHHWQRYLRHSFFNLTWPCVKCMWNRSYFIDPKLDSAIPLHSFRVFIHMSKVTRR